MEHISWWPEVMNGKVQVGGKGGGSQRATGDPCSDGNILNLQCVDAKILVMVLFLTFARSYYWEKLGREYMGSLCVTPSLQLRDDNYSEKSKFHLQINKCRNK